MASLGNGYRIIGKRSVSFASVTDVDEFEDYLGLGDAQVVRESAASVDERGKGKGQEVAKLQTEFDAIAEGFEGPKG